MSYWYTELGIKQIYICPDLNYAAAVHADRWIPVLPNTDSALYLAITYQWFKNGTYDKEYLKTHAIGVEAYEAYVMGKEDGVPKTPEWAATKCGVPARVIRELADEWASKRTSVVIGNGGPGIRGPYATEPARLQCICLAMQGLGKPGANQLKMIEWGLFDFPDQYAQPMPMRVPNLRMAYTGGHPSDINDTSLPKTYVPKAILEGKCDWWGVESETAPREDQFIHRHLSRGRKVQDPRGLDGFAVMDHLLERWQQLHRCHAPSRHRIHVGPASLDGKRCHARGHHPAG